MASTFTPRGFLAAQCGHRLPLRILKSAAGYYVGTVSDEFGPVSRESVEYWPTAAEAQAAFELGQWTQRRNP